MKYLIKKFIEEKQEDGSVKKLIGFEVTNTTGQNLYIDKRVDNTGTDEEQIAAAQAAAQPEIDEWNAQFSVVGREWDAETNSFAPEPEPTPEPEPVEESNE